MNTAETLPVRQTQTRILPKAPTPRELQKRLEPIVVQHTLDGKRNVSYGNRQKDRIHRMRQRCLTRISVMAVLLLFTLITAYRFTVPAGTNSNNNGDMIVTVEPELPSIQPVTNIIPAVYGMTMETGISQMSLATPIEEVYEPIIIDLPIFRHKEQTPDIDRLVEIGQLIEYKLPDAYYPGVDFSSMQPFMCYTKVDSKTSPAYKVLNDPDRAFSDDLGFRRSMVFEDQFSINGEPDYAIALGNYYKDKGSAGGRYLIVTSTGMYTAIVGDEQDDFDTDRHNLGHYINGTMRMIEFIVDKTPGSGFPQSIQSAGSVSIGSPVEVHQGTILHIFEINPDFVQPPPTAVAPPVSGGENFATVWNFLIGQGFTPEAAAGVLGNLRGETTTVNPNAINYGDGSDGSNSIGIIQWNSGRAKNLKSFANEHGLQWDSLETQLAFIIYEMPSYDSYFNNKSNMRNANGKGVISALTNGAEEYKTMTDPSQAARIFDAAYIRSPGNSNQRAKWAEEFYILFTEQYVIQ